MSFTRTQQKCRACEKTVYPMELLSADGVPFHKSCFKCSHCKSTLQLRNYSSMEGVLYLQIDVIYIDHNNNPVITPRFNGLETSDSYSYPGADLSETDLRGADFSLANVTKVNLTNANLEGATATGNTSFKAL